MRLFLTGPAAAFFSSSRLSSSRLRSARSVDVSRGSCFDLGDSRLEHRPRPSSPPPAGGVEALASLRLPTMPSLRVFEVAVSDFLPEASSTFCSLSCWAPCVAVRCPPMRPSLPFLATVLVGGEDGGDGSAVESVSLSLSATSEAAPDLVTWIPPRSCVSRNVLGLVQRGGDDCFLPPIVPTFRAGLTGLAFSGGFVGERLFPE